jgi:hypothetical protein
MGLNGAQKKDNLEFNITLNDIVNMMAPGTCELTQLPFNYDLHEFRQNPMAPSLDKIDSSKGYTIKNVRVVLWLVNAALQECSDNEALPILEALVKGLRKNAKKKSTSSVSISNNREGQNNSEHGASTLPGFGEDRDNAYHHCGADARQDADHRTQESSGDSVGCGGQEVGTSFTITSIQIDGKPKPKISWVKRGGGHLPDKP